MDTFRLMLLMALGVVMILLWQAWQRDYGSFFLPKPVEQAKEISDAPPEEEADAPEVPEPEAVTPQIEQIAPSLQSAQRVRVRTDVLAVEIDTAGGDIRRLALLDYPVSIEEPNTPFVLMDDSKGTLFVSQSGLLSRQEAPTHRSAYIAEQREYRLGKSQDSLEVSLRWESPGQLAVKKTYTFSKGRYLIRLRYEVENKGSRPWEGRLYDQLQRQDTGRTERFMRTGRGVALSTPDKRYEKFDFDDLRDERIDQDVVNGWLAILQHHFVVALLPDSKSQEHYYSKALQNKRYVAGLYGPAQRIEPGGRVTFETRMYAGPKLQNLLGEVAPGLELTADYGILWFLAKPIFWLLSKFHSLIGSWGWSILCVTLVVKLLFFQLSAKSYKSMANMRRVQPRLQAIKERYGNDRGRMNQAMMELYKKEKINPLGGCFPILVQIPVFIALYWVLLESVELRQTAFFWIQDLSIPDPIFVLPLLMGISMLAQQMLNPTPMDPLQEKVIKLLPVIFTVFCAFFPAGLVLYWFANNVLSFLQQWVITRRIEAAARPA